MRSHLCIVAAAALAVGSFGISRSFGQAADTNPKPTVGQKIENAADKTGEAIKDAADKTSETLGIKKEPSAYQSKHAEEIHDVMAQVAEAALTKDGLNDMAERFVDADRNRLGQNKDAWKNLDTLNGRIAEFQKDWKAKYNQDFDIKDEDKVYDMNFAMITEGEELGARTASGKVNADSAGNTPDKVNADNQTGIDKPTSPDADKNLNDKGRNMATVHIAASHGMPALDVPMIHEAGGWKLDIPDSVDATKFRDNVLNALTHCGEKKDQWPADVNDAYRAVTHSVLLATFDKSLDDSAAKTAADKLPADQGTTPQPVQPVQPIEPATPAR